MVEDRTLSRMAYRVTLFQRLGLTESQAEGLADRLKRRDGELDPRRTCWECKHFTDGVRCKAGAVRIAELQLLHHCHTFAWQVPGAR